MATIFLVRHGLTASTGRTLYGRTRGIDLDGRGRAQATQLGSRLRVVQPTAIYSSPLDRCVQTVEPLAAAQGLPVWLSDALIEMDAGEWTGRSLASLRRTKLWRQVQTSPSTFRFPGGEAFDEAQARVVDEVGWISRRHPKGRVVVSTHGDIVRILLAHFAGVPLDQFQRTVVDTASVSVVTLGGGRPHVALVNDTGDLSRFGKPGAAQPWESGGAPQRRNLPG
jgi:probable phosphomutase (TIGR03848 family)